MDNLIACRTCLQPKPLTGFSKTKNGYRRKCKLCMADYNRDWFKANSDKKVAYAKAWHELNREKALARNKTWRNSNLARRAESNKVWRNANPQTGKNANGKRRAHKQHNGTFIVTPSELAKMLASGCSYCEAPAKHIDHIIPLSRGGTHSIGNLTGACQRCNLSKHNKFLMEWKGRKQ